MLRSEIYALLAGSTNLTALVPANKIFITKLPTDYPIANLPAITFQIVTGSSDLTLDYTQIKKRTLQVDLWGGSPIALEAIQSAVETLLFCYSGTLSLGTRVLEITPGNVIDGFQTDMRVFRTTLEFMVMHT